MIKLLLHHAVDNAFDRISQLASLFRCVCFRVNTDNWLGIALAEMYPRISEVNLYAINIGDILGRKFLFDSSKYGIYINTIGELDFGLVDLVGRLGLTQFAYSLS